jgi:4-alpha-glucanotransferase
MAGIWSGSDLADQAAAGVAPDASARELLRQRLADASRLEPDADLDRVVDAVHRRLGASPASLVAATLEDAMRVEVRPNLPGTVAPQRANWSRALPPLEEIAGDPRVAALVGTLQR